MDIVGVNASGKKKVTREGGNLEVPRGIYCGAR